MDAEQICKRYRTLKADRGTWDSHWREVADLVYPRRSDFDTKRSPGEKRNTKVFDSTPIQANEMLASAMVGLNINPATKWFRANTDEMDQDAKLWLDNAADVMLKEMASHKAGFYTAAYEYFMEFGAFGTAAMAIMEAENLSGIMCQSRALSEIVIAEGPDGIIDTVYRRFAWPAHKIHAKWGEDSGKSVLEAIEKDKVDTKFHIIHVVQPRRERDKNKKNAKNMPIMEAYILEKDKHAMHEGGYMEKPIIVGRFYKSPSETYGRSPAMTALPDIKMLNEIKKTTIKAAQKSVDPALIVANDGFLNPLRTVPGGVNVFDGADPSASIAQLPSAHPEIGFDVVQMIQDQIRSIFFIDQLQFAGDARMTATEVLQRTEEKLRLMGPILGRVQAEFLGPVLDRVFGILLRQGKFGEMPETLPGDFEFEYTSQVTMSQKQTEANGFLRAVEVLSPLLQINPQLLTDNINGNVMVRDTIEMFGVNADKFLPEQETGTIQQQRSQIQQLSQALELAQRGGEAGQAINQATNQAATQEGV